MSTNGSTLPAVRKGDASHYLTEFAVGPTGTNFKFDGKVGKFVRTQDETEIPAGTELTCLFDLTEGGWIRFHGAGNPPDIKMGPVFGGFMPAKREELGDLDQDLWEKDLGGKPADPWQHQIRLPLLAKDGELLIFQTTSVTGRRAVGNLLNHCNRMAKKEPGFYPVVQLKTGGFQHRDTRVGWVRHPCRDRRQGAERNAEAGKVSMADDMDDEIPSFA